jgi:hypothetical protein
MIFAAAGLSVRADDITTLDGHTYNDVRDVALRQGGLFFVYGPASDAHGVTVPYTNLTAEVKETYHCDPFELGMAAARQNVRVQLSKSMAFSLDQLDLAKKKAQAEGKMIGFIMEWDEFFIPSRPLERGSNSALVHFYEVFNNGLVLVFVRHESELGNVPDAVKQGFFGPEEGGFAPNMAVVTADCAKFVCEIPFGGKESNGGVREQIFRDKIAVMKKFAKENKN